MNSKEQKELRTKVHEALLPFYKSHGYKLNKGNGVFEKNGFRISWGISSKYIDCIYFNPKLSVLIKNIEDVLERIFFNESFGLTLVQITGCRLAQEFGVNEYDYLGDNEDGVDHGTTYKVDQETDLIKLVTDHVNYMEKVGLPFFEKVNSIEGVYGYLSGLLFNNKKVKKVIGKREILSCVTAGYMLNAPNIEKLLERIAELYEGNLYILDDVQKVKEYFEKV
ncbi:MAG: hypothetical protein OEW75_11910 [Cyclobacteriaceae bacterium]|nr:hypothetical protein [Cyclobacteriaceae bacterium]